MTAHKKEQREEEEGEEEEEEEGQKDGDQGDMHYNYTWNETYTCESSFLLLRWLTILQVFPEN